MLVGTLERWAIVPSMVPLCVTVFMDLSAAGFVYSVDSAGFVDR